jgi:hypothetical protein
MAATIPSIFGNLANDANLQVMIDNSLDALQGQTTWRSLLDMGMPQASLTFETVIGRSRIEAAASIVDPDAPAPLRGRNKLELLVGKIPTMKQKFRLQQAEMRTIQNILENGRFKEQDRVNALMNTLYDDVSKCATAGDRRVDMMLMQGISTLAIDVTTTNNPDGAAYGNISLLARAYQKQGVPVVWSDITTSKPITDIENYTEAIYTNFGRTFGKIMMSRDLWLLFKRNAEVIDRLKSFYNIGKANGTYSSTLNNVNEMFAANGWPLIEVVNDSVGIEDDGIITVKKSFNINNVAFVPNGKLGMLENAYSMHLIHPVANKSYATFGATLVSKWCEDDPLVEFTGMEMNAFPALTAIDGIYVLTTNVVQANFAFTDTSFL